MNLESWRELSIGLWLPVEYHELDYMIDNELHSPTVVDDDTEPNIYSAMYDAVVELIA